uniref:Uncharacterized protein n=1 Tax=Euplotes crassus TaxID=5936 RepID=A0A7S3KDQ4_EUPCR|mmetsp:Transcript_19494/g.19166  ORF Transcript_19494/g.19166 Transcript_19494/m.19166 type:complete len:197 (+) Transcript_19494:414-1004(+)
MLRRSLNKLIVLGSLANGNTSKLPKTHKLNFDVKTIVDPAGYNDPYFPKRNYGEEYIKNKENKLSRYDFKKHARQLLNTSDVDQVITLQQLQKDRLDKIDDIERSLKVDDNLGYTNGASELSSLNTRFTNPYASDVPTSSKFIGSTSEFVTNAQRQSHSVDGRRDYEIPVKSQKFSTKFVASGRHMDDPFIYGLGL